MTYVTYCSINPTVHLPNTRTKTRTFPKNSPKPYMFMVMSYNGFATLAWNIGSMMLGNPPFPTHPGSINGEGANVGQYITLVWCYFMMRSPSLISARFGSLWGKLRASTSSSWVIDHDLSNCWFGCDLSASSSSIWKFGWKWIKLDLFLFQISQMVQSFRS